MKIRLATEADFTSLARVHAASWQSTYRGIVPDSFLDGLTLEKLEKRHRRILADPTAFTLVAEEDNGTMAGFATGGRERFDEPGYGGELRAIYLLAEHQNKGIGRRLIQAVAARLQDAGFTNAVVWVLAGNLPAIAFYQRMGGRFLREQMITIGDADLREQAFAWDDLHVLADGFCPIRQVAKLMHGFPAPWFVSGGWAIDLFLGRVTRKHSDIEIGIYRRDQQLLWKQLPGWTLEKAVEDPVDPWRAWSAGKELLLPVHQVRAANPHATPVEFEFFLNERTDTEWVSRRHENLHRRVKNVVAHSKDGIPYLTPEIQLLFKAKYLRAKDSADFALALPLTNQTQRTWLVEALRRFHADSPWINAAETSGLMFSAQGATLEQLVHQPSEAGSASDHQAVSDSQSG